MPAASAMSCKRPVQAPSRRTTAALNSHNSAYRSSSRRRRTSSSTTSRSSPAPTSETIWTRSTSDPLERGDRRLVTGGDHGTGASQPDEDREQHLDHVVDRLARRERGGTAAALE